MTLTEFLLARIAEDEQLPLHTTGCGYDRAEYGAPCSCGWDDRLAVECKAKRRIVERASRSVVTVTSQRPSPFGHLSFSDGRYYADDGRDVTDEFAAWHAVDGEPEDPTTLRILATVYANHPDYRAEWKP